MDTNRIARFATVGVANTVIDFGIFNVLLHFSTPRAVANVAGIVVALVFSYLVNSRWTFERGSFGWRTALTFAAVTAVGMSLNTGLVFLLGDPARFPLLPYARILVPNAAKVLASGVSLVWNYLGYSKFVFREPAARKDQSPPEDASVS